MADQPVRDADTVATMQAKDIPDEVFIAVVAACQVRQAEEWGSPSAWCHRQDVTTELSQVMGVEVPWKVVLAKAAKLIKRKRMDGCTCGCRGDFDLRGYPDDPFATPPLIDGSGDGLRPIGAWDYPEHNDGADDVVRGEIGGEEWTLPARKAQHGAMSDETTPPTCDEIGWSMETGQCIDPDRCRANQYCLKDVESMLPEQIDGSQVSENLTDESRTDG